MVQGAILLQSDDGEPAGDVYAISDSAAQSPFGLQIPVEH
jgi:hypothetical protein